MFLDYQVLIHIKAIMSWNISWRKQAPGQVQVLVST